MSPTVAKQKKDLIYVNLGWWPSKDKRVRSNVCTFYFKVPAPRRVLIEKSVQDALRVNSAYYSATT